LPFYLLCYTGCSSFGAVSRAKSVLSGADSAGAGSIGGGASGGGVTLPTALMFSFKTPQISDTIQSSSQARNNEPIKAYVVTNDITTAQELTQQ
jgi:hypothetical protein